MVGGLGHAHGLELTNAVLYPEARILTATFDADVDPDSVDASKFYIREAGFATGGIQLAGSAAFASGTVVSLLLTDAHVAAQERIYSKRLAIETGAVASAAGEQFDAAFGIGTAFFAGAVSVQAVDAGSDGLGFSRDGTKMFVGDYNNRIREYALGTAFDVSTARLVGNSPRLDDSTGHFAFSPDGSRLFVSLDGSQIRQYDTAAPFDTSNLTDAGSLSVGSEYSLLYGIALSTDGRNVFVADGDDGQIRQYGLPSPFDLAGASYAAALDLAPQEITPTSFAFGKDGTRMLILDDKDAVFEYALPNAFNLTGAVYGGTFIDLGSAENDNTANALGLAFDNDGRKMFVVNNPDHFAVSEYALGTFGMEVLDETASTIRATANPDAAFVTIWQTTSANEEIMIPAGGMGGSYTVTWGDASISTHVLGDQTHVYEEPGTYIVSIYGDFTRIYLPYHPENSLKLLSIEQWGDIRWESMRGAFNGATNMVYRATDTPDLSAVTDTSEMFRFALRFNGNLSNWDVSSVTDMSDMFSIAGAFNGDISTWNVSSVTDMSNMFLATNSFDQNLGNWYVVLHDTSISGANETLAISAQNAYLDGQNPTYAVDDPRFVVTGGALAIKPGLSVPPGSYEVTVTSTGGFGQGNSKKVEISVGAAQANSPPSVDAGEPVAVREGAQATLNATATDADEDIMAYSWRHDSSLEMILTDADTLAPSFTAPQVHGNTTITFTLTADDGMENGTDTVQVTVLDEPANSPPSVDAGEPVAVREGAQVTLNATASDQDGDQLTYSWRHDSSLEMILTDADTLAPSFTAPQVHGNTTITFTLTADDGRENGTDTVQVTVLDEPANSPPPIDAGGDQTVEEGGTVTLSGSATDPNGDSITYTWSQTGPAAPRITFANASAPSTTFTAPPVTGDTTFTLMLTADDGTQPATDTLNVTVKETRTAFITTWTASDSDRSITLPMSGTYSVLWGDGSYSADVSDSQSHVYTSAGTYTVIVLGDGLEHIYMYGDTANARQLMSIEQWGDTKWTTMYGAFGSAANMVYRATDAPDLSGVTSLAYMFADTDRFNGDLSSWDVSGVTDMIGMFHDTTSFNGNLSSWNVSGVTDMVDMFHGATSFNQPLSSWDVSSVTDMGGMFFEAHSFNDDLSSWDVSEVTDMFAMFHDATSFNGDLSAWNVSKVTYMGGMFHGATSFNGDLSSWDVSEVTDMSAMFHEARSFNGDLSSWDVSGVTDMSSMFDRATSFNGDLSAWDVSEVTNMNAMFFRARIFNGDLSTWDVSEVTKMIHMFRGGDSFNGDLSAWDVSGVTDMSGMFHGATSFNGDLSAWDVSGVTDMSGMFYRAISFNQNLGAWYVVLDGDTMSSSTDSIGIAAQNRMLNDQNPIYTIDGAATNGDKFRIANGTHLALRADQTVAQGQYNVTIKSTGSFGVGNSRIVGITVGEDVVPQTNNPPSVEAGPSQAIPEGSKVRLNGSATDPDDDQLTYSWSHDSTLDISLANADSLSPTFTAPGVDSATTITFTLNVTDRTVYVYDTVTVTVLGMPAPDIADVTSITPDGLYHPGQTVDVRINFTKPVNLEAFTIQDGGRDATGGTFTMMDRPSGLATVQIGDSHYALVSTIYDNGVQIIDITDPASPVAVAAIADGTNYPNLASGYAITTVQMGNLHYALVASFSDNGVQIINITDPASPSPVAAFNDGATYTELQGAYSITTTQIGDSHYALVAGKSDDGVQIIDITDPASPAPTAALRQSQTYPALRLPISVTTVQIGDSHYALTTSSRINSVQIIDITDPARPSPVAALTDGQAYPELDGAYSITTTQIGDSHYALVAADGDDGVQIINITDPARPSPVAALTDGQAYPELDGAHSITTTRIGDSHYALVASIRDDGVQIINITDPARPSPVAALTDGQAYPELDGARTVTTTRIGDSHYALVAGVSDGGVQMIDITDPAHPFNPLMPYMRMDLDGDRRATYVGQAHGNHALVFEYVVKDGDQTGDLAYSGTDALVLRHSGLTDAGDSSDLSNVTLPEPGASHSLSRNKQIDLRAWSNSPPTADAGTAQAIQEGDAVTLNGTASDPDGDQLTYSWNHDSSLEMILTDADSLAPSFTAPQVHGNTTITFTLTADDGRENGTDTVQVIVLDEPANSPPSVDAGEPVAVREGAQATLNATASDPDGDQLTYSWNHDSSLEMILTDADSLAPSFTAPQVHGNTTITFTLTADDGRENGTDTVQVIVLDEPANSPPSVDAGEPVAVREGAQATLNATASDPDGDQLTYSWNHDSSLEMILTDADSLAPSFTAPQVHGNTTITFTLTADDGRENGTDTVQVIVLDEPANSPPSVDAGEPVAVREGAQATLNATASDPDGDQLTYSWNHDSSLEMILTDADSLAPSFTAPQVHGNTTITFTLTADDGRENGTDTVQVIVLDEPANSPPSVDAGEPVAVREGAQATLNATASDPDGDQLTYSWNHDSTLDISMANADSLSPTFTAPQVSANTTVVFMLTADDGTDTRSDAVAVTILDVPAVGTPNGGSGQNTTAVLNPDGPLGPRDIGRITMTSIQPGTIQASWEAPSETPAGYRLSWAKVDESYLTWTDRTGNAFPTDPAHTITGLEGGETYKVKVRATYEGTSGDWSDGITATATKTFHPFITTWQTTAAGESITIPVGDATGIYTIDWGDGNVNYDVSGDQGHTYDDAGTYTVRISGDFARIYLNGQQPNADKLQSIEQWGDVRWESMRSAFQGASSMEYHATDTPDLSGVTAMRYMFEGAASFNGDLSDWDVSSVTDMHGMFYDAASFNGDISAWNVSSVTAMRGMFMSAASFNANLSAWDVSSVTDMSHMFRNAASFNGDISAWDVSSVTAMSQMFQNTASFNANLSAWDVSRVTDMDAMFDDAHVFDQNLGTWYIVLDNTVIEGGNTTGTIGRITAQNSFLDGQDPVYSVESGMDSDHFEIDGTALKLRTTAQNNLADGSYTITITSTGEFGTGNSRTYEIVVTGTHANP